MSWLTKWFRGKTQVRSKPVRRPRTVRLSLEALEDRQLMATNLTATLTGGLLRVEATAGADTVHVRQSDNQISVDGIAIQTGTSSQASVAVSLVNQVEIRSLAGNDQIWLGDVGKALAVPVRLLDGLAGDTLFIPTIPGSLTLGSDEQSLATCTDGIKNGIGIIMAPLNDESPFVRGWGFSARIRDQCTATGPRGS